MALLWGVNQRLAGFLLYRPSVPEKGEYLLRVDADLPAQVQQSMNQFSLRVTVVQLQRSEVGVEPSR